MADRAPGFRQHTAIAVEPGVRARIGPELERLGSRRPALVIDPRLLETELTKDVLPTFDPARVKTIEASEPTFESVARMAAGLAEVEADGVVAVGGGSALDTSKLARGLLAAGAGDLHDLPDELGSAALPLIALPTTAGTGAEVGAGALAYDERQDAKVLVRRPQFAADVALADAELTIGLPSDLTAFTGLDAFAQALMAFVSAGPDSVSGQLAQSSMAMIWRSLPRAVAEGGDLDARSAMMLGSVTSALAMYNAPPTYAGEHVFAEQLGPELGVAHGHAVAAFLPGTVEFNREVLAGRFSVLARILCVVPPDADEAQGSAAFSAALRSFVRCLGVPPLPAPADGGVERLAVEVERHDAFSLNPREIEREQAVAILNGAFDGSFNVIGDRE